MNGNPPQPSQSTSRLEQYVEKEKSIYALKNLKISSICTNVRQTMYECIVIKYFDGKCCLPFSGILYENILKLFHIHPNIYGM